MAINVPELWYQIIFQPGVVNKLSLISPYDECTVNFSCNQHIKVFRAWSIFGKYDGTQKGLKIVEFTNRDANVQISFKINANNHMKHGEGAYTILFYVENDEGISNMYAFLLSTENNGTYLDLYENEGLRLLASDVNGEPEPEVSWQGLKFTAEEDNSSVGYSITGTITKDIYTSTDAQTWSSWDGTSITLNKGDSIYVWNKHSRLSTSASNYFRFITFGKISASGNCDSMINFSSFYVYNYCYLFKDSLGLIKAPELPTTNLTSYCYYGMFSGCTNLIEAPKTLPAINLTAQCYRYMFFDCSNLINSPEILFTTKNNYSCYGMFQKCSKLNNIKIHYTGEFGNHFNYWVESVSQTGDFYYNGTYTTRGRDAIPTGWTVHTF